VLKDIGVIGLIVMVANQKHEKRDHKNKEIGTSYVAIVEALIFILAC